MTVAKQARQHSRGGYNSDGITKEGMGGGGGPEPAGCDDEMTYDSPFSLTGMYADGFVVNVQAFSALLHTNMADLCSSSVGTVQLIVGSIPNKHSANVSGVLLFSILSACSKNSQGEWVHAAHWCSQTEQW